MVEDEGGIVVKLSLTFSFPTYTNQAEQEACLAVLRLARQLGAEMVSLSSHCQLIASQINGITDHVIPLMQEYLELVKEELKEFCQVEVIHIPQEQNTREDILLKLASTRKTWMNPKIIYEILRCPNAVTSNMISSIQKGITPRWTDPIICYIKQIAPK